MYHLRFKNMQPLLSVNTKICLCFFNYIAFLYKKLLDFCAQDSIATCSVAFGALELLQIFNDMYIM